MRYNSRETATLGVLMLLFTNRTIVMALGLLMCVFLAKSCTHKAQEPDRPELEKEPVIEDIKLDLPYGDTIGVTADPKIDVISSEPAQTSWKIPNIVIDKLGDISGQTIADIGAGVGYLSFKLLLREANVIATDMDETSINMMNSIAIINLDEEMKARFETRLANENDPLLLENEVDKVMMMHLVGFIDNKREYLTNLRKSIKPGGQLMIMDFKMKRLPEGYPTKENKIYPDVLEEILYDIGYQDITIDDTTLDYQYIIIAQNYK